MVQPTSGPLILTEKPGDKAEQQRPENKAGVPLVLCSDQLETQEQEDYGLARTTASIQSHHSH